MARQLQTPVAFQRSLRGDQSDIMTSGRAGKVIPVSYIPLLRGDSCAGRFQAVVELNDMPRPLDNRVMVNWQAWFVPKPAHPQFSGYDEFLAAYQGKTITALGQPDRPAQNFFTNLPAGAAVQTAGQSEFAQTLGLHFASSVPINVDLFDAFTIIHNFRLAAHSSKLQRRKYYAESAAESGKLPRAFWPSGRYSRVVPDYERALVVGALDLDVTAGRVPVRGIGAVAGQLSSAPSGGVNAKETGQNAVSYGRVFESGQMRIKSDANHFPDIFAEMQGITVGVTLADIDMARTTQAFAKQRAAYAGNDTTGFNNDDAIVADLMQGLSVPEQMFNRPWLLDSKREEFAFSEIPATDGASLGKQVVNGFATVSLSLNVPKQDVGGVIIVICEVLPERLDERQSDEWINSISVSDLPDALRDVQRVEPVDQVLNRRLDMKHANPAQLYGFEPMNDKWNRQMKRLGGAYYQPTPGTPQIEQRIGIWQVDIVNPTFTNDHFLAPENFPHYVFSDTAGHAFEISASHDVRIVGLTQIGDVLSENNDDYREVQNS